MHVGNTIHEFRAGDTGHPQAQEIYAKLSALIREIKDIDYVLDTSIVLHYMSDELKECLLQHSEKIAVALVWLQYITQQNQQGSLRISVCLQISIIVSV